MSRRSSKGLVRHLFSEHEDELLRELFAEFGDDWTTIAKELPDRSPRQCKERWNHYLAPHVVQKAWSCEEDEFLLELVKVNGTKWKAFESYLIGRTDTNIKNRYNVLMRKEAKQQKVARKTLSEKPETTLDNTNEGVSWAEVFGPDECDGLWASVCAGKL
jgi:hypothetical protein